MKTIKPETEIRNLKREREKLRAILQILRVPPIIIFMPDLVTTQKQYKNLKIIKPGEPDIRVIEKKIIELKKNLKLNK